MKKTFSIITPLYNAEKFLTDTINSVIHQEASIYEYIIVDGLSTDNSIEIVKSFQRQFPENIRTISEPDKGIFDAMNKGIGLARGEYLFFLGAGDTMFPNILADIKPRLRFKSEMVYGEIYQQAKGYTEAGQFDKLRICFDSLPHQATFYHHSVFQKLGGYATDYPVGGDRDLNIHCFGDDSIEKRFIDMTIANYEGNGFSTKNSDEIFLKNKPRIIRDSLGSKYVDYFQQFNSYPGLASKCWLSERVVDFFKTAPKAKVGIFGTGSFGESVGAFFEVHNQNVGTNILVECFFDNNPSKWGEIVCGRPVFQPTMPSIESLDKIIIASIPGKKQIIAQLMHLGIAPEKIVTFI